MTGIERCICRDQLGRVSYRERMSDSTLICRHSGVYWLRVIRRKAVESTQCAVSQRRSVLPSGVAVNTTAVAVSGGD